MNVPYQFKLIWLKKNNFQYFNFLSYMRILKFNNSYFKKCIIDFVLGKCGLVYWLLICCEKSLKFSKLTPKWAKNKDYILLNVSKKIPTIIMSLLYIFFNAVSNF